MLRNMYDGYRGTPFGCGRPAWRDLVWLFCLVRLDVCPPDVDSGGEKPLVRIPQLVVELFHLRPVAEVDH